MKTIAIAGTFDTKGEEYLYIKRIAEELGLGTLMIHTGVFEPAFVPDVSNREIAYAAGKDIEELAARKDRALATELLSQGLEKLIPSCTSRGNSTVSYPLGVPAEPH